jgi:hypothetical protein
VCDVKAHRRTERSEGMERAGPSPSMLRRDEEAVSEVLGVIMLLAMVMTIMSGVFVFLQPYLADFEDNANWKSAQGIANRLDDRLAVAAASPEGIGIRTTFAMQSTSIRTLQFIEDWDLAADLSARDAVTIERHDEDSFTVTARNQTARSVTVVTPVGSETYPIAASDASTLIEHNVGSEHWSIITVHDADDLPLHRSLTWAMSGLEVHTSLGMGEHRIAMSNHGRIERLGDAPWDLQHAPALSIDTLVGGEVRLSLALRDVTTTSGIGGGRVPLEFVSLGAMELFSGEAWNLRFAMRNTLVDSITPQIHEAWLMDYSLQRSSGTLDTFVGLMPYKRASGADGFTVATGGSPLHLEVDMARVEVRP